MKSTNPNVFDSIKNHVEASGKLLLEAPWADKDFYAAWLAQSSYYIRHSTRLLALAGARIPLNDNPMHNRFLKLCGEEKGRENLPLLDMKTIGRDIADFPEFAATKAFYQTQYYWIEHVHPHAFFGYILFLETLACDFGPAMTQKIEKIHGSKAIHFIQEHSDADIDHVHQATQKVAKLSPEHQEMIKENLQVAAAMYDQMYYECIAIAKKMKKKAAA